MLHFFFKAVLCSTNMSVQFFLLYIRWYSTTKALTLLTTNNNSTPCGVWWSFQLNAFFLFSFFSTNTSLKCKDPSHTPHSHKLDVRFLCNYQTHTWNSEILKRVKHIQVSIHVVRWHPTRQVMVHSGTNFTTIFG